MLPSISTFSKYPSSLSVDIFEPSTSTKCILPFAKSLSSLALRLTSPSLAVTTSASCCCLAVRVLNFVSSSFDLSDTCFS